MEQREGGKLAQASLPRRGLMAAVSALAAGALLKSTERVAMAADGSPVIIGATNTGNGITSLSTGQSLWTLGVTNTSSGSSAGNAILAGVSDASEPAVWSQNAGGFGLTGVGCGLLGTSGANSGVLGTSSTSYGVQGVSSQAIGLRGNGGTTFTPGTGTVPKIGVLGVAGFNAYTIPAPDSTAGVYGLMVGPSSGVSGPGVLGISDKGNGVYGISASNVGVLGTSTTSHGLYGASTNGYGLYAISSNSTAVVATSNNGNAVQGASNGNVGVLGTSNSSIGGYFSSGTATGLYATGPAAGYAARFDGPVQVNGAFTVVGGPKSAAVPHPDGSHRRLYCVESPESWFEDFGRDQLRDGRARVRLDPDFDALVRGDNYYVFLTEQGDCGGLYVSQRGPHSFEVRARKAGAEGAFDYRVVAKRKDIAGARLERVDVSEAPQRPAAPTPPPTIVPQDIPRPDPNARPPEPRIRGR